MLVNTVFGFQSSFSEALYCYVLIWRMISLRKLLFQSSFSEALYCYAIRGFATRFLQFTFNPHFQRLFTATGWINGFKVVELSFQSSFSEALYCY